MIPLPVLPAINLFTRAVTAYDVTTTENQHREIEEAQGNDYTIWGSLQPATERDLQLLASGDISDGAVVFYTRSDLGIRDTGEVQAPNGRQTYLRIDGEEWRVVKLMNWQANGRFNKYVCTKYFEAGTP